MKFSHIYFISLMTVLLLFVSIPAAQAQIFGINPKSTPPLAKLKFLPQEEFEAQTRLIDEVPFEDNFLSYQLRIPKNWSANTQPPKKQVGNRLSRRVLGVVARYLSPPKNHLRSFFTLEALDLTYEIGARNWFINYVLNNGLSLEQIGEESKKQIEAIYIEVKGDITYVVRIRTIINGPRMIIVRYYVPQELYKEEHVQQAQVLQSFELTNREEVGVEKLEIYGFLDQSFFDYPISWTLSAPLVRSITRMRAMLYHNTLIDKLDGQINIYLTNKMTNTSRADEVFFYQEKFKIKKYELGKYLETPKLEYHEDISFGITEAYEMNSQVSNMINYELWVSVMEGNEYIYIISLLTPARHEEFYTWARNVEAYRLVVKGMRREDESVDYYRFIQ